MCAERATPEGVAELTELCAAIDRPELPYVDSLKTDFAFHRKIVGLTGNISSATGTITPGLAETTFANSMLPDDRGGIDGTDPGRPLLASFDKARRCRRP